jgi:hypothetical protein
MRLGDGLLRRLPHSTQAALIWVATPRSLLFPLQHAGIPHLANDCTTYGFLAYPRIHRVDRLGRAIQIENLYRDIFGQCNDYIEGLQNIKM